MLLITNKPLQRDNNGTWLLEDVSVNDGFGEADFIEYNSVGKSKNMLSPALKVTTPDGAILHLLLIILLIMGIVLRHFLYKNNRTAHSPDPK